MVDIAYQDGMAEGNDAATVEYQECRKAGLSKLETDKRVQAAGAKAHREYIAKELGWQYKGG
jgi:hypothetical protein